MRMMRRRTFVSASAGAGLVLSACAPAEVKTFASLAQARAALEGLRARKVQTLGAWKIGAVLDHLAQSIEYSLNGFPEMKSSLFRHTAGAAAWSVFSTRGAMSHSLSEPIPGAPALSQAMPQEQALARLLKALQDFDKHTGVLKAHFAYGDLSKADYTRAHLMHLANHWQEFVVEPLKG